MPDDAELLRRYDEENSETAFAELVRRHIDAVYAAATRQVAGDTHRANDITQIVFATLARKARTLTRHPTLLGWLHRTTFLAAAKLRRTEARRSGRERKLWATAEWAGFTAPAIEGKELEEVVVDSALSELAVPDREAVALRFLGQRSFSEIGQILGLSEDAARRRVERALRRLRERLASRGITSTEAAMATRLIGGGARFAPAGLAGSVVKAALESGSQSTWLTGVELPVRWMMASGLGAAAVTAFLLSPRADGNRVSPAAAPAETSLVAATRTEPTAIPASTAPAPDLAVSEIQSSASHRTTLVGATAASEKAEIRAAVAAAESMMAQYPDVRRAIVDWQAAKVHFQFGPLFDALGLDHQGRDAFASLVRGDHFFGEWGLGGEFLEFHTPRETNVRDQRDRLENLLGAEGLTAYDAFKHTVAAREIAAQVAARLSLRGASLTREQAAAIVEILDTSSWRKRNGGTWDDAAAGWKEVEERSARVLTERQQQVVRHLAWEERAYGELADRKRVAAEAATANDPANAGASAGTLNGIGAFAALQARIETATRQEPQLQTAEHDFSRRALDWRYEGVVQQLELEPAARRSLLDNLQRRAVEHEDMLAAARSLGIADHDPALKRWNAESEVRYRAAQQAVLGDHGAQVLRRFEDTTYPRHIAHGFAGMATMAGIPVEIGQVEQLIQIMSESTRDPPPGVFPARIDIDWAEVDRRTGQILTPHQARLFQTAEAPGVGRGGARFVVQLNHALLQANRQAATQGKMSIKSAR